MREDVMCQVRGEAADIHDLCRRRACLALHLMLNELVLLCPSYGPHSKLQASVQCDCHACRATGVVSRYYQPCIQVKLTAPKAL